MVEMLNITEFMEKYCQDILKEDKVRDMLDNEDIYSYDVARPDPETGKMIKYVIDDKGIEIPVLDIIEMDEEDFKNYYRTPEAMKLYHQYISNFKITYGEDILLELRNSVQKQNERIKQFKRIRGDIDCI